jgi:hypothetical protein
MDTSGFYKVDGNGEMLFAQNSVLNANYSLSRAIGDTSPKVDGWQWFPSDVAAYATYGLGTPPAPQLPDPISGSI